MSGTRARCCWTSTSTGIADSIAAIRASIGSSTAVASPTRRMFALSSGSASVSVETRSIADRIFWRSAVWATIASVCSAICGSTRSADTTLAGAPNSRFSGGGIAITRS